MSSEYSEGPQGRRQPRQARPVMARPASSAGVFTILLAVVAVVLGVVILRSIGDGGSDSVAPPATTTIPTTVPATDTTVPQVTTTTMAPMVFDGATVVVANANRVNGSAGAMSRELDAAGFTVAGAVNAAVDIGQLELTVVYYDSSNEAARLVADSVNRAMGGDASVAPLPPTIPTETGQLVGQVLVLLGNDKAGLTLEELASVEQG